MPMDEGTASGNPLLIPGLPDDLALLCLAKISHGYHAIMLAVCKRWHYLFQSPEYAQAQAQQGRCGDWLFVLTERPKLGRWSAFDPVAGRWHLLPPVPGISSHLRHCGFGCVGLLKKLLVIGGFYTSADTSTTQPVKFFATNEVLQFDLFTKKWSRAASMRVARCNFACAAVGGKVFVAGGCSSSRRSPLASAEVYDIVKDSRWEDIAPLSIGREECVGVGLRGMFYVLAGVAENDNDQQRMVEVYDTGNKAWHTVDNLWLFSRKMACPVTATNGYLYALDDWDGNTIKAYNPVDNAWEALGPVPGVDAPGEARKLKGFDFGLAGLRTRLYLLGGKFLKWQPADGNWKTFDVVRLNSVLVRDVSIGDNSIAWNSVRSMGRHCGSVIGCTVYEDTESYKE